MLLYMLLYFTCTDHTQAHHIINSGPGDEASYDLTTHNDILLLCTGSLIRFAKGNLVDQQW